MGSTTPSISVIETGDYGVTVLDANNCIDSTLLGNPIHIEVWDPQPDAIQQGDSVVVVNGPFTTYQWFFNGLPVPGATDYFHLPSESGNYYCEVTDDNGCVGESYNVEFTFTGISDLGARFNLVVYPNPTRNTFVVQADLGASMDIQLSMKDVTGRDIIIPEQLSGVSTLKRSFNIEHLAKGVYYLQIKTPQGLVTRRVIKS